MPNSVINNIVIKGLCAAVPENKIFLMDRASDFEEDSVEKIIKNTGIESVYHVSKKQTASDLAYIAAEKLLNTFKCKKEEIGALFLVTQTPDYSSPATSFVLQHRLGLSKDCICLDINLGCPGYISGLFSIASAMSCSDIKSALLLVAETPSKRISPSDRSLSLLFGDAGTATLLEKGNDTGSSWCFDFKSFGERFRAIMTRGGGYRRLILGAKIGENKNESLKTANETCMDGLEVFYFSTNEVPVFIEKFINDNEIDRCAYDYVVLHQANLMILKQIAKKLGIPLEKIPLALKHFGNTSNTSIPLTLSHMKMSGVTGKKKLLLCGFGVGLSWGIVDLTVDFDYVLTVVRTNNCFIEG